MRTGKASQENSGWTGTGGLVLTAAALFIGLAAPQTSLAAGPNIAPSSCGGPAAGPVPNAYCDFGGGVGAGVTIAHDSCNVKFACENLG
jgi:hypothetical protein